jgi:hypothetical protein
MTWKAPIPIATKIVANMRGIIFLLVAKIVRSVIVFAEFILALFFGPITLVRPAVHEGLRSARGHGGGSIAHGRDDVAAHLAHPAPLQSCNYATVAPRLSAHLCECGVLEMRFGRHAVCRARPTRFAFLGQPVFFEASLHYHLHTEAALRRDVH